MAAHKGGSAKGSKKGPGTKTSAPPSGASDTMDQRLTALAEQLGTLVGTLQNKAEELIDREELAKELSRLKQDATGLLDQLGSIASSVGTRSAKPKNPTAAKSNSAAKASDRGPVDAPGKRHRPPPPQERVSRRMSQPKGTQTPPKLGNAARRGRG
jgi:hypothetical protein